MPSELFSGGILLSDDLKPVPKRKNMESVRYNINNTPEIQNDNAPVMTTGQWVLTMIVFMIPLVNIIMLFVWAFGRGNPNRANFCKALLLIYLIGSLIGLIFILLIGGSASGTHY
ncbi:hypothetical protein I7S79_02730 [Neisseria meningitidis]|uniref:hypothetical protein n=1 Tax=Neisseria TaxID=482 RepID=UPI0018D916E4|nr:MULTISPECIES: hypothetical protein [Neisseria]MBH2011911.1 hypothetical protein [Neisseria meningitidis]MBH2013704.1 hypothetical protein [Neisseria meningitidis]MBH2021650.1 hypothetical protein [Neisseria meningitidis]MBH2026791.1 hypothetical protein [Neisseria meningitidis]MBH2027793.1 hypothetical protein [Neisseria meningitidis]